MARREELEFVDKTRSLERSCSGAVVVGGDGDRVEMRSRLQATELMVIFSVTPPLEAVRFCVSLMRMMESEQAKSHKLMFFGIHRAHFRSPSRRQVFADLLSEKRERSGWCGLSLKSMYGTRDAAANFSAIGMDTLTNMKMQGWKSSSVQDVRLHYQSDDFAIRVDERDLLWLAKELDEALIVGVRGVLRGGEGERNHTVESSRAIRTNHKCLAIHIRCMWKLQRKGSV